MSDNAEGILSKLELEAAKQEADRARIALESAIAIERSDYGLTAAKDAMRPVFLAAVEQAAPILQAFLVSPEWERLVIALGRIEGREKPGEIALPSLYLSESPYRKPNAARAVFKGEVRSVSPYTGGVFHWTIGKHLLLTRTSHFMQPPQVDFQTTSGLQDLLPWFESTPIGGGALHVALRLCELVCEGKLLGLLAGQPPGGPGSWLRRPSSLSS